MKITTIILLLITSILSSSNAQNNENMIMKYNYDLIKNADKIPSGLEKNDSKYLIYSSYYNEYPPRPYFYWMQKIFYPNGKIKSIKTYVGKSLTVKKSFLYDEEGNLTVVNEESKFDKIKIEDLLAFLEEQGHINLKTGLGLENIEISNDGQIQPIPSRFRISNKIVNNQYWIITIIAQPWNNWTEIIYHLDKDTGEVLFKESKKKYPIM